MPILREEDTERTWLSRHIALCCQSGNLGDVFLCIVFSGRQSLSWRIAKSFCSRKRYLDIYHLLLDKDGYLSGDYAFVGDGKHFEKSGYVAWANYMKTHYVDSSLPDEK